MRHLRLVLVLALWLCQTSLALAVAGPSASKSYDANNDEVDWGAVNDVTTNDVSLCMWVNPTDDASSDYWLGHGSDSVGGVAGYSLASTNVGDLSRCTAGDGITTQVAQGNNINGVWTFICCVWDGTNDDLYLYENNVNTGSDTTDTIGSLTVAANLQSGETNADNDDANGLAAYASIFLSYQLTNMDRAELQWKPEGIATNISFVASTLATDIEKDWVGNLTATVSGTVTPSANGPPVLFGLGLPL